MTRRSLLRMLWAGALALAAWPVARFVTWREPAVRNVTFAAQELQALAPVNSVTYGVLYKDQVFLLPGQEPPLALSARCSHLGCLVSFDALRNEFHCPCHQSVYDGLGRRLAGPTTQGLARLPVSRLEDGGLVVEAPV